MGRVLEADFEERIHAQVTLEDSPLWRKQQGRGGQDGDWKEAQQGCDSRGHPGLGPPLQAALGRRGDLGVSCLKTRGLGFCTPGSQPAPGYTQAFVALHRASREGDEAPAWQDEPLRVTGASPQEQAPQRLGGGRAGEGWVAQEQ